jgi:hypothetical protein
MEFQDKKDFEKCPPSVYYESLVERGERSAEALYYLLTQRLSRVLQHQYRMHGEGIQDAFDDTIDDFFLFLHDGIGPTASEPFALLQHVREKKAFFSWLISTYRIFLLNKRRNVTGSPVVKRVGAMEGVADEGEGEESMTNLLVTAIAYADQELSPRNRFLLYRMLLSLVDAPSAIPQEAMAAALGMHPVTYRVTVKRQKDRLLASIEALERGETLSLDAPHAVLRDRMAHQFDQLRELLLSGYEQALDALPQGDRVVSLRERYSVGREGMMHEERPCYGSSAASIIHRLQKECMGRDRLTG